MTADRAREDPEQAATARAGDDRLDWSSWRSRPDPDGYDARWSRLVAAGGNPHGEADLVAAYRPTRVLDAGCGTGRVAIELARRGVVVHGVDADPHMIAAARAKAPHLRWALADLADLRAPTETDRVEVVVLAGNVVPFVAPQRRAAAVAACAAQLTATGRLIAGFALRAGWPDLDDYDRWCAAAGLLRTERFATWSGEPYRGGDYAVSVHRPAAVDDVVPTSDGAPPAAPLSR